MVDELEFLQGGSYLSLSTLKKSGDTVETPVWFGQEGDDLYIFSAANAGKVKRLRNFSEVRVAACTVTGAITGEWFDGTGEVLSSEADIERALAALHDKYGWQMKVTDLMSRLTGKYSKRAYIRVTLNSSAAAA